ncbi:MAG TPA: flagellar basal-body MS-ring/collar protein FliF [Terriglobales bacterium]|nr:flagellar basal-body MS-ring/collar protein FliF [Terriglobales bacterium]
MAAANQMIDQLRGMVNDLSTKQKLILAGGAVLTIATLLFFVRTLSKPDFKPLYTNMEPADAQSLAQRLTEKHIVYELTTDGKSISVPADKLDAARLELASEGMPHTGRLGFELFDKMNWGETEFDEKVNYQRALEGELERTIQKVRNVQSVRVHLVLPTDSLFVDRERAAKASVILNLRYGHITPETQLAIARLVSGAVDKLSPENVTIIDANDDRPVRLAEHDPTSGAGLESELSTRILDTLAPVVGPEAVRASVNVDYDSSTSEENQETYDPKLVVAVATQRADEQVGGGGTGGVPGTSSNVPGASANAKTAATPSESFQTSHSESSSYAVSKVTRRVLQPAGRIRRVTAAVVVDDAAEITAANGKQTASRRKRTAEELKQIEQLASAAIGLDSTRGDTLTVQNLSFRKPEAEVPPKPGPVERVRVILTDWSSLIRYGTVLLLFLLAYFLLLRPVKKHALLAFQEVRSRGALKVDSERASDANQLTPGQQALVLKQRLVEKVKAEPGAAGQLVQNLLRGEGH